MPIRQVHPIGLVLGAILHVVTGWRLADSGPVTLAVGLAVALAGIALGAWAVRTAGDQSVEHPRAHNGRSVRLHAQPYVRRVGHALRGRLHARERPVDAGAVPVRPGGQPQTFAERGRDSKRCSAMRTERIAGGCGGTSSADESYLP